MTEGVAIMGSGRPGAAQPRVSEVEMLSAVDRRSGTVRIRHQDNVPAAEPLLGALPFLRDGGSQPRLRKGTPS
jgi:hypothetical protein